MVLGCVVGSEAELQNDVVINKVKRRNERILMLIRSDNCNDKDTNA